MLTIEWIAHVVCVRNRLELLNCSDNRIESVRGIGTLHALISLNLGQ